jgi:hypothetical protein
MVLALDIMTMGVLAANSAVMTASGAPAELREAESAGKRRASPGRRRETAKREKRRAARKRRGGDCLFLLYCRIKKRMALRGGGGVNSEGAMVRGRWWRRGG